MFGVNVAAKSDLAKKKQTKQNDAKQHESTVNVRIDRPS